MSSILHSAVTVSAKLLSGFEQLSIAQFRRFLRTPTTVQVRAVPDTASRMASGILSWLSGGSNSSSQPAPVRQKSKDGGYVAPDRNMREICYESRDLFFECLDKNDILDANREDEKARKLCPKEVTEFERDCAKSWVSCISGLQPCYNHLSWFFTCQTDRVQSTDQVFQREKSYGI